MRIENDRKNKNNSLTTPLIPIEANGDPSGRNNKNNSLTKPLVPTDANVDQSEGNNKNSNLTKALVGNRESRPYESLAGGHN